MSSGADSNAANAATAPSPLTVGKAFVKQYYQVLQANTAQIHRFYQPTSLLSDAEGSHPTDPSGLEDGDYEIAGRWGIVNNETKGFAMEIGAIDAQTSINNSILLVVTGHVSSSPEDTRKTFIHTFFLSFIPNTKRYYVANDILRFLEAKKDVVEEQAEEKEDKEKEQATTTATGEVQPTAVEAKEEEEKLSSTSEKDALKEPVTVVQEEIPAALSEEVSVGGGVEESKEIEEEDTPKSVEATPEPIAVEKKKSEGGKETQKSVNGKEGGKGKRGKGGRAQQQQQQQQQPSKPTNSNKPAPGSWASLVASSPAVSATPVPPSPSRSVQTEKPDAKEKSTANASTSAKSKESSNKDHGNSNNNSKGGQRGNDKTNKRDPDCTLVLKNLPDGAKDADLVAAFEGFAASTGGKILGTTVSVHRGLGFVDYDSIPPVMAAIAKHKETPIEMNGRVLEVEQKTAEQRARRNNNNNNKNGGGFNRSGSPGNRGGNNGRNNQNRRDNGKGRDRGGRNRGDGK